MIKINRIKIKNFRQFKDVEIEFDEDKGVFLFIGKNGIGKSNFLNAVCWCLYGKQPFKTHDQDKRLLNEEVAEVSPNDRISVELEFSVNNDIYSIRRFKAEIQEDSFVVMRKVDGDWLQMPNPNHIRENFLPESVINFFFFDGEAIQNLFKGDYARKIKASVWKISDVQIIDDALDHLNSTRDDHRKKLTKDIPEDKKKEEELMEVGRNIEKSKSELETNESTIADKKEELAKLRKEEERYSKYRDLYLKKDEIENQLLSSERKYKEYQAEINSLICANAPFYYAIDGLREVERLVNNDIEKGEIPSDIKGKFIQDLITRKTCICGHHIAEGGSEYKELKKLLGTAESKDEREILLKDSYFINTTLDELKSLPIRIGGLREKRARENVEIEKLQRQIKDIKEQLKNAPDKEVGDLEKTIQHVEGQISDALKEVGSLKRDIELGIVHAEKIRDEINETILKKGNNVRI
ncbi:MAG: AAA family ATPase, partial [Candidatus Paceibacterota bacterium]